MTYACKINASRLLATTSCFVGKTLEIEITGPVEIGHLSYKLTRINADLVLPTPVADRKWDRQH